MNRIRIYTTDKNLIEVIKNSAPLCRFYSYIPEKVSPDFINVIITDDLPEKILKDTKYILRSYDLDSLTEKNLSVLFDLWPEPLTPSLLKFYFAKLMSQLTLEVEINSEETEYQKRILEMARQDYLTGLATRWYLQEYIESNEDEQNITCIYFDLDNFKFVNDTYGHQAGDRVLAATAEMMQREFSDGFAARMGGDEFMVVLTGFRTLREVEHKVNIFIKTLVEFYRSMPTMKTLSVSAGISQKLQGEEKSIDALIHESDTALYCAKKSGKNRCRIYNAKLINMTQ